MEGGSQAQDHGRAICAKIRYSVSSTFATGCGFNKEILHEAICNDEFSGNNVVTMLRQLKDFRNIVIRFKVVDVNHPVQYRL